MKITSGTSIVIRDRVAVTISPTDASERTLMEHYRLLAVLLMPGNTNGMCPRHNLDVILFYPKGTQVKLREVLAAFQDALEAAANGT